MMGRRENGRNRRERRERGEIAAWLLGDRLSSSHAHK